MIEVGDFVLVHSGTYHGSVGRVVVRKPVTVELRDYLRHEIVYGVVFEDEPNGRGYPVFFKPNQIERTDP